MQMLIDEIGDRHGEKDRDKFEIFLTTFFGFSAEFLSRKIITRSAYIFLSLHAFY